MCEYARGVTVTGAGEFIVRMDVALSELDVFAGLWFCGWVVGTYSLFVGS